MAVLRIAAGLVILAACGGVSENVVPSETAPTGPVTTSTTRQPPAPEASSSRAPDGGCADVVAVDLSRSGDGSYRVSATVSSADTGIEKYADEWRIVAPDGTVLGVRVLTHPHVDEQPFTRSLAGVEIGSDIETVTVEARDSVEGYCGVTMTAPVP